MECEICGVSGSRIRLLDAVSTQGVIKVCEKCSREEGMPLLKRPTTFQLKEAEREQGTYVKGVREFSNIPKKNEEKEETEESLMELVNRNYESKHEGEVKPRLDLEDNFHWIIMRTRRLKKLTQKDLAKELSESEAAIKMAEQGILPEDDYRLVNKLESFLGIRLRKSDSPLTPMEQPARVVKFDKEVMENLTIADLKEMKNTREEVVIEKEIVEEGEDTLNL